MTRKKNLSRQRIKYSVNYHAYFNVGGCLGASVEAPSKKELLTKMDDIRRENKDRAEVITFEPIKKIIEISEAKGKFSVFRRIRNPFIANSKLSRYYNRI